ncbi:MAG: YebC/PmpR family DNA-binding transcriptional regulator [Pseudanabaenaceae cyanobacterium]
MAGHSKWANIKRQKARVDAARGATFARLSRAIIVAAKHGLPDPAGNFQLRTAIEKAKAAGVPNDNIERAIAKGAGKLGGGEAWEEIRYEGYGPGGAALIIEALTDNRVRTAADVRAAFNKYGGNLGETGCVSWLFALKGVLVLQGAHEEEKLLEDILAAGAESYEWLDDPETPGAEVFGEVTALEALSSFLQARGYKIADTEWRWIPSTRVVVNDVAVAKPLLRLIEALEALDDVQNVTGNFDIADEIVEELGL